MPFRDAYKKIGLDIEQGKYNPSKEVKHTHEGSIGNLNTDQIQRMMSDVLNKFGFEKVRHCDSRFIEIITLSPYPSVQSPTRAC
jgi:argininosuccinate lyase